jgi:predicted glycoside hydrolase/deacetylase ChbG (UPF0249 family)
LRWFERHLKSGFQAEWLDKHQKSRKFQQIDPAPDHRSKKISYNERMSSDLSNSLTATGKMALSNCRRLPARFDAAKKTGVVLSRRAHHALKHSGVGDAARISNRLRHCHAF